MKRRREIPAGAVNGINTTFALAKKLVKGSELLTVNGLVKRRIGDYSVTLPQTVGFTVAPPPAAELQAFYAFEETF